MLFQRSLSDSKSPHVSGTHLSILADLNAVVWMVSTCPLISKPSIPFTKPLGVVPSAPIIIGITATFIFHTFFSSLARSRYLSFFLVSFIVFYGTPGWQSPLFGRFSFFLLTITRSGRLVICLYIKIPENFVWFSKMDSELWIYHWFVWSNLNFLYNSQWFTLPIQLCLVSNSFFANLLHSLIRWLIVSSLSPHNQHYCVLSIFALTSLVLMAFSFCY